MMLSRLLFICLIVLLSQQSNITAQWSADPAVNNPICTAANTQNDAKIVTDGSGGAIITWYDYRAGSNIYARRITSAGAAQWTDNGEAICTAVYEQYNPAIISDGAGGAYIAWEDRRDNTFCDIFVQRIDADGSPHSGWPVDGVCICSADYDQLEPAIISDGSGGAIIAWADNRTYSYKDIYAQKISSSGVTQWPAGGIPVCTAANEQVSPVLAGDEAGGAYVVWRDRRADSFKYRVFVQRIDASGNVPAGWIADGKAVSTGTYIQDHPVVMADGAGGAIIAWEDYRSGTGDYSKVYAHRIDADGSFHTGWTAGGVVLSNLTMESGGNWISITSDQNNGAIAAWVDYRNSSDDIYAQRITSEGSIAAGWPAGGAAVCTAVNIQILPSIAGDGSGGAIITWQDQRLGTSDANIFAQRINPSGVVQWAANGVPVCSSAARQEEPVIVSDGIGGAIIAWTDTRNSYYDIYSAHINENGALPVELDSFTAETTANGQVTLNWTTATEVNNYGFEIERSTPAPNAEWETVGFVKGHGNSNSPKAYSFTDNNVNPGSYSYRLKQVDNNGEFSYSDIIKVSCMKNPSAFGLAQNHPNPFNPKTTIKFELPSRSMVKIEIYNSTGEKVALLADKISEAGYHKVQWEPGAQLSSGVYYYTIFARETEGKNSFRSSGKMLYLK